MEINSAGRLPFFMSISKHVSGVLSTVTDGRGLVERPYSFGECRVLSVISLHPTYLSWTAIGRAWTVLAILLSDHIEQFLKC